MGILIKIFGFIFTIIGIAVAKLFQGVWWVLKNVSIFIATVIFPAINSVPEMCIRNITDKKLTWEDFYNRILIHEDSVHSEV